MHIYLIRHGEQSPASPDLTPRGREQARLTGLRLRAYGIQRIYASPVERARQTAEEMNQSLNVPVEWREDLREIHMGDCERRGWDYVRATYPDFVRLFEAHSQDVAYPPDGENGQAVWLRARRVLDEAAVSGAERVALVTHGGVIRALICGIFGIEQARRFYLGAPLEHCSLSLLKSDVGTQHYNLHTFNDFSHLVTGQEG